MHNIYFNIHDTQCLVSMIDNIYLCLVSMINNICLVSTIHNIHVRITSLILYCISQTSKFYPYLIIGELATMIKWSWSWPNNVWPQVHSPPLSYPMTEFRPSRKTDEHRLIQTYTDRQTHTNRHTDTDRKTQTDRQRHRLRHIQTDIYRYRHTQI